MHEFDRLNYVAIQILDQVGNLCPTQTQINTVESLLELLVKQVATEQLSEKEIACLYWAGQGKSAKETAKLMKISKFTVELYRKEIRRKLHSANMTQAIYKGVTQGFITIYGFCGGIPRCA